MKLLIFEIFMMQLLACRVNCDVNNIVRAKVLHSNQNMSEKNTEVILQTKKLILNREQILDFLSQQVPLEQVTRLKQLLDFMSPTELRHIDILIYLLHTYKTSAQYLLQSIFEILLEDERNFATLMRNFT